MNLRKFNKNLKKEFKDTFNDEIQIIEPEFKIKRKRHPKLQYFFYFFLLCKIGSKKP